MTPDSNPVIKKALGDNWNELAAIVKQHYDITPGDDHQMVIRGVMSEVFHSRVAKLFLLPGRLLGALVPHKGKNIPTEVKNWTTKSNRQAMYWHRTLLFPNREPAVFCSRMEHSGGSEIIEYVKYGVGIRLHTYTSDNALCFRSLGYVWNLGAIKFHIPNWAILGDALIIEKPLPDNRFFIDFTMTHPIFGKTFSYSGTFEIEAMTKSTEDKSASG